MTDDYRAIFQALPFPAYVFDRQTLRFLDVNRAALRRYGYTREEFLRSTLDRLRPPQEQRTLRAAVQFARGRRAYVAAARHQTKRGRSFDVEVISRTVTYRGRAARMAVSLSASGRFYSRRLLNEPRQRLEALFNNALDAILMADNEGRFLEANPAACEMLGWRREALLDMTIWDVMVKALRPAGAGLYKAMLERGRLSGRYPLRCRTGAVKMVEVRAVAHVMPGVNLAVLHDISDRVRAERALQRSREQYRRLSERALKLMEDVRARVARDLHDDLGQALSGFKMDLAWLAQSAGGNADPDVPKKIAAMMDAVDATIHRVRRIAAELRPGVLDRLGLVDALRWQASEFERRFGIRCHFKTSLKDVAVDRRSASELFRIVQEALTNVGRHAHATRADVIITGRPATPVIVVRDNGRGMDPRSLERGSTLGLTGMQERAALIGAAVFIEPAVPKGTAVTVRLSPVAPTARKPSRREAARST